MFALYGGGCPLNQDQYENIKTFARRFVGSGVAMQPEFMFRTPGYRKSKREFESFLHSLIDGHTHGSSDRREDLIDRALQMTYMDGSPFDDSDVAAVSHLPYINGVIYGGRVTAYMLFGMLAHPEWLERLEREADAAFLDRTPDVQTLRRMPLMRGALYESLRLYPIAPAVPRYAAHPFEFEGYHIETGTPLFICTMVSHFLPELFPEPYAFDPERFLAPRQEHHQPGSFAPFGLGTHTCPSVSLVETVALLMISTLLRTVRVTLDPPDYRLRSVVDPVPAPEAAFHFKVLEQRSSTYDSAQTNLLVEEPLPDLASSTSDWQKS